MIYASRLQFQCIGYIINFALYLYNDKSGNLFMNNPGFQDKTLLLEAGLDYDLKIIRILKIPGGISYFVGKDHNGLMHLIPASFYSHYGIRSGDIVRCRLDRINCLGRFFFEPDHPYYRRGGTYHFGLVDVFPGDPDQDNVFYKARVRDDSGCEWVTGNFIRRESIAVKTASVLCQITGFKKGKPLLRVTDPLIAKTR
jgi:hypothetical protein